MSRGPYTGTPSIHATHPDQLLAAFRELRGPGVEVQERLAARLHASLGIGAVSGLAAGASSGSAGSLGGTAGASAGASGGVAAAGLESSVTGTGVVAGTGAGAGAGAGGAATVTGAATVIKSVGAATLIKWGAISTVALATAGTAAWVATRSPDVSVDREANQPQAGIAAAGVQAPGLQPQSDPGSAPGNALVPAGIPDEEPRPPAPAAGSPNSGAVQNATATQQLLQEGRQLSKIDSALRKGQLKSAKRQLSAFGATFEQPQLAEEYRFLKLLWACQSPNGRATPEIRQKVGRAWREYAQSHRGSVKAKRLRKACR